MTTPDQQNQVNRPAMSRDRADRLNIGAAMLLIAGAAVGLWLGLGGSRTLVLWLSLVLRLRLIGILRLC